MQATLEIVHGLSDWQVVEIVNNSSKRPMSKFRTMTYAASPGWLRQRSHS
jgi:hypothetical protein